MQTRILFLFTMLCAAMTSLQSAHAAVTVINTNDSGAGSLRQALVDAVDGDMIDLSVTTPATITLTSGEDQLSVNGNANSRVFHISSGAIVTISGLSLNPTH